MNQRKYKLYVALIVLSLGATIGFFVNAGNFIIPIIAFVIACGLIYLLKRERDISSLPKSRLSHC